VFILKGLLHRMSLGIQNSTGWDEGDKVTKKVVIVAMMMMTTTMMMITMACRHIPTMTKSHHGGNMSVIIKVGMCQCQNLTIPDKVQLGPVGRCKLFNMPPVL